LIPDTRFSFPFFFHPSVGHLGRLLPSHVGFGGYVFRSFQVLIVRSSSSVFRHVFLPSFWLLLAFPLGRLFVSPVSASCVHELCFFPPYTICGILCPHTRPFFLYSPILCCLFFFFFSTIPIVGDDSVIPKPKVPRGICPWITVFFCRFSWRLHWGTLSE